MLDADETKKLGAYFTPYDLVDFIFRKSLNLNHKTILEPSFGDGAFIQYFLDVGNKNIEIDGVEVNKKTFFELKNKIKEKNCNLYNIDFLKFNKKKYDLIIGNPPFVRSRNLDDELKATALKYYRENFKTSNQSEPSTWYLFIYHAMTLLNKGGTISFILPFDITFVNYSKALWQDLFDSFGKIELFHSNTRYFGRISQDTVVLKASRYGEKSSQLDYLIYNKAFSNKESKKIKIKLNDILNSSKPFKYALLPDTFVELENKMQNNLLSVGDIFNFKIGYVSGNKKYFHPEKNTIKEYEIPSKNLLTTISNTKSLKNIGLYTSNIDTEKLSKLFYPIDIDKNTEKYLELGLKQGVHKSQKTSSRPVWSTVPLVEPPEVLVNIFDEFPLVVSNDKKYIATNTFLGGYLKVDTDINLVLSGWYSLITKLYQELEIHSLGVVCLFLYQAK